MKYYTSIPTSTPLELHTTPPSTKKSHDSPSIVSHSRTGSLSIPPLPVYSSNRFKRRFRGILWSLVIVTIVSWIGIAHGRGRNGNGRPVREEEEFESSRERRTPLEPDKVTTSGFKRVDADHLNLLATLKDETPATGGREDETIDLEGGTHESLASLPICSKTLLFKFAGLHGQGSELNLLLRLSTLATRFNYTLLLDSSGWNYGPFTSYFQPLAPTLPLPFPSNGAPSLRCRPPNPDKTKRTKIKLSRHDWNALEVEEGQGGSWVPDWVASGLDHVAWGPQRDMDGLDRTILNLFVNSTRLEEQHARDLVDRDGTNRKELGGLSEGETLNLDIFGESFERLSDEAKRIWRVNGELQRMVDELGENLGLGTLPKAENERELKEVGDLVIGLHVRLGDKYLETDRIGPHTVQSSDANEGLAPAVPPNPVSPYSSSYSATPGLQDSTITNYFAAAIKAVNNLLLESSQVPPAHLDLDIATTTSTREEQIRYLMTLSQYWTTSLNGMSETKPTLILMSDDQHAVEAFKAHPVATRFRLVGTSQGKEGLKFERPGVEVEEEETASRRMVKVIGRQIQGKSRGRLRERALRHGGAKNHQKIAHNHPHKAIPIPAIPAGFNEITFNSLPLSTRISQSRLFVRDVTFLSTRSDALVITGSSNVGRLMSLLMGDRGKGRIRSLDTRWFPTAKFA